MSLVEHARNELKLAGLFDADSDYNGMLGTSALEIVELFSKQGHSGASAEMVTQLVSKLMRYETLTELTYGPEQWNDVSAASGVQMWQHKRKSTTFSKDGGKTHYDLDEGDGEAKKEPVFKLVFDWNHRMGMYEYVLMTLLPDIDSDSKEQGWRVFPNNIDGRGQHAWAYATAQHYGIEVPELPEK